MEIKQQLKEINTNLAILADMYAYNWVGVSLKEIKTPKTPKTRSYGAFKY